MLDCHLDYLKNRKKIISPPLKILNLSKIVDIHLYTLQIAMANSDRCVENRNITINTENRNVTN